MVSVIAISSIGFMQIDNKQLYIFDKHNYCREFNIDIINSVNILTPDGYVIPLDEIDNDFFREVVIRPNSWIEIRIGDD